jgi:hypothetical protein
MEWPLILALALLVPCVLMPAFFIWYLNRRGAEVSIRFTREIRPKRVAVGETEDAGTGQYEQVLLQDLKRYLKDNPPVPE